MLSIPMSIKVKSKGNLKNFSNFYYFMSFLDRNRQNGEMSEIISKSPDVSMNTNDANFYSNKNNIKKK
jgi:hypothetical protein